MDIYAKVKYNKHKELAAVVNGAFGKIKGSEACCFQKYGLKAARRAPQFSKR